MEGPPSAHTPSGTATPEVSNLTHSQLLIWTGQRLHGDVPLYNMVLAFRIDGPIDPQHFRAAFQALLDRCDALRAVVEEVSGVPRQRVRPPYSFTVPFIDLSSSKEPEAAAEAWIHERSKHLLPTSECLFDTAVLRVSDDRHIWYLNQHHLVTDGWSTALVYRYMSEFYARSVSGTLDEAPDLPPYSDFASYERDQRRATLSQKAQRHESHPNPPHTDPIRLYGKRPVVGSSRTVRVTRDIEAERSLRLRSVAAESDVRALTPHLTLFTIFSSLLFAYLYRIGDRRRLRISAPSHNRVTAAFKETVGLFIETYPLEIEIESGETYMSLLKKVRHETGAFMRRARPGTSTPEMNRNAGVLLNYVNAAFGPFAGLSMTSEWIHAGYGDSHHVLRLQVHDFDDVGSFRLHFDFNEDLFDERDRHEAVGHFMRMLDGFLDALSQPIDSVDILSKEERERILVRFNRQESSYVAPESVVSMFKAQVELCPTAPAVVADGWVLSYSDLNRQADRLARCLRAQGVGRESLVPIYLSRSPEMIVGVLGVLMAGAAFVPIDSKIPSQRVSHVLRETSPSVLVTGPDLARSLPAFEGTLIFLDKLNITVDGAQPPADLHPRHVDRAARPRNRSARSAESPGSVDLAYVMYTSGSSGRPKGVMITNGALAHYVAWARSYYLNEAPHDFPLFTPLSFDLTLTSLFLPLVSGGRVVVYREEGGITDLALFRVLEEDAVDVVKLTPSHLAMLRGTRLSNLRVRTLIVGGEDLLTDVARAAHRAFGRQVEMFNEYGPTESTVGCVVHRFEPERDTGASVPIGTPQASSRIYLLNDRFRLVPVGVEGEIYIAGPTVARGYIARPDLSAERFLPDPFDASVQMYRTGDVGRWQSDGTLHYLGRKDDQVKIRGFRVERGEIESVMLDHPHVETCFVHVLHGRAGQVEADVHHCTRCGLPSGYPGISFDDTGLCNVCRNFDAYHDGVRRYFKTMDDLRNLFAQNRSKGQYDCLMLLSGGKDSTYALYRLVEMGLNVLAFTLDNGYLSAEAKANIRRVTDALRVDHQFGTTPAMNAIFVDSLKRFSNVCNGCFKTLYTLALKVARDQQIPFVVTGLSRGQFFETRLTEELFLGSNVDPDRIDEMVLEARRAYHSADDVINRLLDAASLVSDDLFDKVQFVDFYRYCDVSLDEMVDFLNRNAPWIRPADTGRSTNCLINEVGIYVHRKERGYHNYALPYSWDVRLGHKERDAALHELNDDINPDSVHAILREIQYDGALHEPGTSSPDLIAYFTGSATIADIKNHLAERLPGYMVPRHIHRLDILPLTPNGKIDRARLPRPASLRPDLTTEMVPPRTPVEARIAAVWEQVLRLESVGVTDEFIALGGNSLLAIQIISRINDAFQIALPLQSAFEASTVARLSRLVEDTLRSEIESLDDSEVRRLLDRDDARRAQDGIDTRMLDHDEPRLRTDDGEARRLLDESDVAGVLWDE